MRCRLPRRRELLKMMAMTVSDGTARRQFRRSRILRKMDIAAKTGTLSGTSPKGRYYWFVAAAPVDDPEIAIATLVIDPGGARINGSGLGRQFMERYFLDRQNLTYASVTSSKNSASGG